MDKRRLQNSELLEIKSPQGVRYTGGSQMWFHDSWKRTSGCGPTTASGMLWYLARSRRMSGLCETGEADQSCFLRLMDTVFDHILPGPLGVYSPALFASGVMRYGNSRGIGLQTRTLKIPPKPRKRPTIEAVCGFISDALRNDLPVAFLNLTKGSLKNLGSWHWVMIAELDPDSMTATIYDHGAEKEINLEDWLKTSVLGGGFVSISL